MLEIKNITKTFNPGTVNEKVALNDLSLTLKDGDFVTVIGGNGAGKSTLLNAISGVWKPGCGTITIDGNNITNMPEHKRAKFLGRVSQDPLLGTAAGMMIEENLALAYRRRKRRGLLWLRKWLLLFPLYRRRLQPHHIPRIRKPICFVILSQIDSSLFFLKMLLFTVICIIIIYSFNKFV